MSQYISVALRQLVSQRAIGKCEYCLIHQTFSMYRHEIDHVIATKHGGQTTQANLVLACLPCNRHKGSDLTSLDPFTGKITPLFNPRIDCWDEHFKLQRGTILGVTAVGRTTAFLLQFNEIGRLQLRQALVRQNLYPDLA
ncbi:MAG: HNH endonuclease signature motif containing protein [Cyanobacteria bacterium P01_A01_bin.116]